MTAEPTTQPVNLKSSLAAATIDPSEEVLERWAGSRDLKKLYRALLKGETVINLRTALLGDRAGTNIIRTETDRYSYDSRHILDWDTSIPLAFAPAGSSKVKAMFKDGDLKFYVSRKLGWSRTVKEAFAFPRRGNTWTNSVSVPPVSSMKSMPGDVILFEASWDKSTTVIRETIDPALLRPVQGSLYRVIDVWDLTPVEIAAFDRSIV